MRGSVLLAAGLLVASSAAAAQETPRVLEVTLADLDKDSLDFLIGWERWKSDILDLASEGYARFTFVPLLAVEPGLPLNARFSGRIFGASGQRAARRPNRTSRPPPGPFGPLAPRATERPTGAAPAPRTDWLPSVISPAPLHPNLGARAALPPGAPRDLGRRRGEAAAGVAPPAPPPGEPPPARRNRAARPPDPGDRPPSPEVDTTAPEIPASTGKIARSPLPAGRSDRIPRS